MKRSEPLDGLRGIAVLLVLASHASNAGHDLVPGLHASGIGRSGVFLFFVLSSYLLTSQALGRLDAGESVGWGRFALRRVLRVLPAYALCLGVYVALGAFAPTVALEHLALVRAEAHFWTIPVEVMFYVLVPVIGLVLARVPGVALRVALVLAIAALARIAFPPDFPAKAPEYRPNVAPFLPIFLIGCALAAGAPRIARVGGRTGRAAMLAGWGAVLVLAAMTPSVWSWASGEPVPHRTFHLWFGTHAVLWGVVLLGCLVPAGGLMRRVVSIWPLRALGWVSYSVYLFHAVVLAYMDESVVGRVPEALVGPLFLLGAVGVGTVSYWLVERPFLGVLRGAAGSDRPSTSPQ